MGLRTAARALGWQIAPGVMSERGRDYAAGLRERLGVTLLAKRFVASHGSTVLEGPFRGLFYPPELIARADAPVAKLLGVYEQELHLVIAEVMASRPALIVDIGAADGYYAVGLARISPAARVVAFELARSAREGCSALAAANDVSIELRGKAATGDLRDLPLQAAFVLCDIEGAEATVLDPAAAEALASATVVVELHEHAVPGVTDLLRERFSSHECAIIASEPRSADQPELAEFTQAESDLAVDELRAREMAWAVFRPRA
jgi:hypothetical protein